jgi:hypothetical protein
MNYYFILFVLVIFPFTYATLYYLLRFSRYEGAHQLVTFVRKYDSRNLMSCTLHHFEIDIHWRTHFSFHLMKRTCLSSHRWIFFFGEDAHSPALAQHKALMSLLKHLQKIYGVEIQRANDALDVRRNGACQ